MNEIDPVDKSFFTPFQENLCDQCGECLSHCPVMDIPIAKAKREIANLINNKPSKILKKCQSCFTCNFYCPNGCNPTSLILQRWNEQYTQNGLKERGKYFMTLYPFYPNFRSYAINRMTSEEKEILNKWKSLTPLKSDTLTYPGCNVILTPTLVQSSLFADCDIRGRLEYCCGETLFRTGYFDALKEITKRLDKWFNLLRPKHLLVLCTAGTNSFRNVLPSYGLKYQFESITPYLEWLWTRMESGEIEVKNLLDLKVTIQDSCYSKMFGTSYMDLPRKILEKLGCEIIELPNNRENMRCCGIGAGFSVDSAYDPFALRQATAKNLTAAKNTGVNILAVYCSGCNLQYHVAKKLYFSRFNLEIYHIIELIQLAIGETPKRLVSRTASNKFRGIITKQFPKLFSRKTFHLPPITEDPDESAF